MFAKIKLYRLPGNEYRYELIAANRAVLGSSDVFVNKEAALQAIAALRDNDTHCTFCTDPSGKHYLEFYSLEVLVMRSQTYSSEQALQKARQFIAQTAQEAKLVTNAIG